MRHGRAAIGFGLWLCSALPAAAQPSSPDIVRPDIAGSIGWLNANKSELSSHENWYNRGLQGAVAFGWYWSTHIKTELEASASRRADLYASNELVSDGIRSHVASEYTFSTRRLTAGLQYQFEENAWFHPHVATGIDFNWETSTRFDREVYQYIVGRPATIIRPAIRHPKRTDLRVRPFVATGFKAYMTPRSFFRSDLRVVARERIEDVMLRFGFGVDF